MAGVEPGLGSRRVASHDRKPRMGSPSMHRNLVLTLTGPDRIGIVDDVTGPLLGRGGNVEMSRMARLGGEFAILMLVSLPEGQFAGLEQDLERLAAQGYKVTTTPARPTPAEARPGWIPYRIEVHGADHAGDHSRRSPIPLASEDQHIEVHGLGDDDEARLASGQWQRPCSR